MRKSRPHQHAVEADSSDIIVYPNRGRMLGWIALSGIPTLFLSPFIIGPIILMITTPDVRNQAAAVVALVLLMGSLFVMGAWLTRMLVIVTFSGEPTLVINHAGIRVGKIYGSADIFLPWEEVEAVYSSPRPPYKLFFIRPVDTKRFLARLSPMMRFTCRLSVMGGSPIVLYQSFLDQPAEAILEHMHTQYKRELQLHKVKKQEKEMLRLGTRKQEIILYVPRWHLWAAPFFAGITLLIGLALLFLAPRQLLSILMGLFFLSGSVVIGPVQIWKDLHIPALIVDNEGIASPRIFKYAKLKWEEIDAIYCRVGGGYLLIDASPSGNVAFLARQNKGRLVIPRYMDITVSQTVFTIPQTMLPIPADQLIEQIKAHFQDQLAHYDIEASAY